MKKLAKLTLFIIITLLILSGCSSKKEETKTYASYEELNGQKIGVTIGTVFEEIAKNAFPDSQIEYYNSLTDAIAGLKKGDIEGIFYDYGVVVQACNADEDLAYFSNNFKDFEYGLIFSKDNEGNTLRQDFNSFLENECADIDFEKEYKEWANAEEYELYDFDSLSNENGIIHVATDGQGFPFAFVSNNQITGLEAGLLYKFCKSRGYGLEFDTYNFAGMLAAVSSGKADIGASGICYTEERKETYNYSDIYVTAGTLLMVRKDSLISDIQTLTDLNNKIVSATTGTVYDQFLKEQTENVTFQYYDAVTDGINALIQGKASACLITSSIYKDLSTEYENLRIIDTIYTDHIAYIFPKSNKPSLLQEQIDEFILELKESGELEKIWNEWKEDDEKTVDYSNLEATNGTIRFAISSQMGKTSNFLKDGKYCGLDIDIMVRFAKKYGYDIEFQDYSFSGVLAAISSGKADVGGSNITKTEERMESLNFSEPYYEGYVYAITYDNIENESDTFIDTLKDNFYSTFIKEDRYKLFISGIKTTLTITISACVLGTILGFALYFVFKNSNGICSKLLNLYSWFITGLPTVVLLMVFYYVIFVKTNLSAEIISIIVFSILFSLAVFSILKTCFMAVDKGQFEAAYALGYSKVKTITNVIIPEIAPMFFPSYRGEVVGLIKATSIVGYIAVQDLTKVSDIVRSRTYEAFFPLIAITIIYILLTLFLDILSRYIERKINTKNRKIKDIMKGVKTK